MSIKKGKRTHTPNRRDMEEGLSTSSVSDKREQAKEKPSFLVALLCHPLSVLIILTAVVLLPCLMGDFVWDDVQYIVLNENLRGLQGLARIWLEPSSSPQYYPLTFTTYWLEYQFLKLDPAGYHLVNLCLHLANTALVFVLLRRLGVVRLAWLAALLFGIHPLHVEPVAWLSARKDLLSGLFALLSLCAWMKIYRQPSLKALILPLSLFLAALLSKPAVCPLPAVMLLIAWWKEGRVTRKIWTAALPFIVLSGLAVWVFGHYERSGIDSAGQLVQFSLTERIQIAGYAFWFYIAKTLYPHPLMTIYPRWHVDSSSLLVWLFPATALLSMGLLYTLRQRLGKGFIICVAVYALMATPYLGLVTWSFSQFSFVADRYAYLAGIGLLIPLSLALLNLANYFEEKGMRGYLPIAAFLLPFAAISFTQCLLYQDSETLFRRNLKHNPESWGVHTALGSVALTATGRVDEAVEHFQEALRLEPESAHAHYNLAVALENSNMPDEAIKEYGRALGNDPEYAEAHNNLAILLINQGNLQEALRHITEAVRLKPEEKEFRENKNLLLQRINQPPSTPSPSVEAPPVNAEQSEAPSPMPEAGPGRIPEDGHPFEQESPR